jgi:hypothetical protein
MRRSIRVAGAILFTAVLVAACGGGDGDSSSETPPPSAGALRITSTNYVRTAQEAVGTVLYIGDAAGFITGAQIADESLLLATVRAQIVRLPQRFEQATPRVVGAQIVETESCSGGGSITTTLDDANNNQDIDAGESARLVANNCVELGVRISGTLGVRLDTLGGDIESDVYSFAATATLESFAVSASGVAATGNGQIRISENSTGVYNQTLTVEVPSLTTSVAIGSDTVTRTGSNLRLTQVRAPVGSSYNETTSFSGTIVSSALESRSVEVKTVTPFVRSASANYPTSGQATVTGDAGSSARVTAQNATQVLVELDADANGVYESSVVKNWSELR